MPKRNKKMFKKTSAFNIESAHSHNGRNGEVFRNFFAVGDDVDPRVSLQYMQDMFMGKIEQDVVTMVFSECAYDVEQTLETLMALSNDRNSPPINSFELSDTSNNAATSSEPQKFSSESIGSACTSILSNSCANQEKADPLGINQHWPRTGASKELYPSNLRTKKDDIVMVNMTEHEDNLCNSLQNECKISSSSHDKEFYYPPDICNMTNFQSSPNQLAFYPPIAKQNTLLSNLSSHPPMGHSLSFASPVAQSRNKHWNGHQSSSAGAFSYNQNDKSSTELKKNQVFDITTVSSKIVDGEAVLVILRGLPGSGKSSLAKELKFSGVVLSTDDYFSRKGGYQFDGRKLSEAHEWNQKRAADALERGVKPVIIDNTNTEAWEMLPYVKMGMKYQYEIHLLEPSTPWKFKPNKLAKRNTHNVPKERIERMLERYDHSVTSESLIAHVMTLEPKKYPHTKENSGKKSGGSSNLSIHTSADASLENNCISLQAVIHQEDESSQVQEAAAEVDEKDDVNMIDTKPSDEVTKFQIINKIDDINELKLLIQEDSEGSTTPSQSQQLGGSSQDVSGWEAITEPDDDFLWTCQSDSDILGTVKLESSKDVIDENISNINETGDDESMLFKYQQVNTGQLTIGIVTSNLNNSISSISKNTLDSIQSSLLFKNDLEDANKEEEIYPYEYNRKSVNFEKCNIANESFWSSHSSSFDWESSNLESWDDGLSESVAEKYEELKLDPKPQCQFPENFHYLSFKDHNAKPDSKINQLNDHWLQEEKDTGFDKFDLSSYSNSNWFLPSYPTENHSNNLVSNCKAKILHQSIETQTEVSDFVLLHKLEVNKLFITSMKTLRPSNKKNALNECSTVKSEVPELHNTPSVVFFDRSTSCEDIPFDDNVCTNLEMVRSCFPEIQDNDLQNLLEVCRGDTAWLVGILLDWGYKYNVPESNSSESGKGIATAVAENLEENTSVPLPDALSSQCDPFIASSDSVSRIESNSQKDVSVLELDEIPSQAIKLVLDANLALQLQEQFGLLPNLQPDAMTDLQRTVKVDLDFAKLIYENWKETLLSSSVKDFQGTEPKLCLAADYEVNQFNNRSEEKDFSMQNNDLYNFSKKPETLTEIMNMELALEQSIEQKLVNKKNRNEDISVIIKRKKLHKMFPGVDPLALDNVFNSNNCSLEQTVKTLEVDIGKPAKLPPDAVAWQTYRPFEEFYNGDWSSWVQEEGFMSREEMEKAVDSTPEAENWRAEAAMHFQMRQEYIRKAKAAFSRSMPDVASFYSQKGDWHSTKFKSANKKAAELILQNKNKSFESLVLDLHGLYVQEAVPVLRKFLRIQKEKLYSIPAGESLTVSIITGRGAHSIRGAKLRPSVMKFLTSTGFRYDEINLGVFNVHLSSAGMPGTTNGQRN